MEILKISPYLKESFRFKTLLHTSMLGTLTQDALFRETFIYGGILIMERLALIMNVTLCRLNLNRYKTLFKFHLERIIR